MQNNRPIGFFDSGVGGLSILKEVKRLLPQENIIFFADQKNFPYGKKTEQELNTITKKIADFLMSYDIKILVIACNTATCYSLKYLRSKFKIPIIGVVPAIKPAAQRSRSAKIAILSTPATSSSAYLKDLIKEFAADVNVLNISCGGLEEAIEDSNHKTIAHLVSNYSKKIKNFGADVVVLGCTHYPIVKDKFKELVDPDTKLVDSASSVAKRLKELLKISGSYSNSKADDLYFTTSNAQKFSEISSSILNFQILAKEVAI
jgi:glutamate racemase